MAQYADSARISAPKAPCIPDTQSDGVIIGFLAQAVRWDYTRRNASSMTRAVSDRVILGQVGRFRRHRGATPDLRRLATGDFLAKSLPQMRVSIYETRHDAAPRPFERLRTIMVTSSMTQAAEGLRISQPSAGSLISNLIYSLGVKLFDRVKGRLVATPEAKHFLPNVTPATDFLARVLADNPSVRVRLLARRSEMMSGPLPTQEMDMATVIGVVETRHFEVEEWQTPCFVAFPADRAPAGNAPVSYDRLRREAGHGDADASGRYLSG